MKKLMLAVCAAVVAVSGAFAGTVYYFDPVNGNDTNDGLTEETAFQNLSKKSGSISADGDEYRLMKGVYRETFFISSPNVTIRGWKAGRDEVIIDGENVRRGIRTIGYDEFGYTNSVIHGLTVRNCVIASYSANSGNNGAGIALLSRDMMVSNCVVYACHNHGNSGGGIALMYAGGKVVDCVVSNCTAAFGGGICVVTGSQEPGFEVRGCTVRNCRGISRIVDNGKGGTVSQKGLGGALYAQRGISISNCTFAENSADDSGGGICLADKGSNTILRDDFITDVQVVSNISMKGGGISIGTGGTNYLTRISLVGNVATNGNGGGFLSNQNIDTTAIHFGPGCRIIGNSATNGDGGGLYAPNLRNTVVSNALFRGNVAKIKGGGVCSEQTGAVFQNCIFDANVCTGEGLASGVAGGAARIGAEHGIVGTFRNCLFTDNVVSNGSGGAIGNEKTRAVTNYVFNCTFVNNGVGGASGNDPLGTGGAIGAVSAHYCVSNSVFYGNWAVKEGSVQIGHGNGSRASVASAGLGYSYENKLTKGNQMKDGMNGCIVAEGDPGFTDAANGDYTLTKSSILVDKGFNQDWMDSATDLRQKKRFGRIYNDVVDIGCYEYWPARGLLLMVR